ncbi:hypothetical protein QJQ45_013369 [Haematococcus lacustris]|nr:hypothetical protein QJQ45_013369 [Haematococcus lacustris]
MPQIRKVCWRHFEVVLVDEFRTTAVSVSNTVSAQAWFEYALDQAVSFISPACQEEEEDYAGEYWRALRDELPPGARPAQLAVTSPNTLQPWLATPKHHLREIVTTTQAIPCTVACLSVACTAVTSTLINTRAHSPTIAYQQSLKQSFVRNPVSSALLTSLLFMPAQVLAPLQANNARSEGLNGKPSANSSASSPPFMQRIGESKWRPLELCFWPDQGVLPAKGKEYPGLGYKRLRDKPPKAQQQQPAEAQ